MPVEFAQLHELTRAALVAEALSLGVARAERMGKHDLVFAVGRAQGDKEGVTYGRGVLEVHAEGFGFLRSPEDNFLPGAADIYVSQTQIRRFKLQTGDTVVGQVREPKEGERYLALLRVEEVNGEPPGDEPPRFDSLTAIYPDDRIPLGDDIYLQATDRIAPLGLGQRGILVAQPNTGRVEWLRRLAASLTRDEDLQVTVLLVGERPEEIHEWRQETLAEVIATPFDEPPARHVQVADIVFERARRMVERGDDVVLLVDSLSRLLRFCLAEVPASGRDLQGVDTAALHKIRRYMGAARALEEGGSLTVIAVLSADNVPRSEGGKTDRVLYDDLHEVVNWELTLSRDMADRGVRPPINIHRSGTAREDRLLGAADLEARRVWRSSLTGDAIEDMTALLASLTATAPLDTTPQTGK